MLPVCVCVCVCGSPEGDEGGGVGEADNGHRYDQLISRRYQTTQSAMHECVCKSAILAWKFECPCMCAVEISWWMVARLEEQFAVAVTSSSCRHLWR